MNKWKLGLGLLALLCSGIVIGVVGTGAYINYAMHHLGRGEDGPPLKAIILRNVDERMHLVPETREKIAQELDVTVRQLRDLEEEVRPRFHETVQGLAKRSAEFLTPEENAQLAQLLDDLRNRRQEKIKGPGWLLPPPPPPPWK